ncbi:MAG: lipid-A-disaccharide synthase N-terminal domain-containing protein [Candidatus Omnitrophica bacterium]|nr:lipid-A-disaccharide synthase N-terminal domain-containing protein [Candidatus Omnitrophota bacterium]
MDAAFLWLLIGFLGQGFFFLRFLAQWLESEKRQESVIPHVFWYFSILGAVFVLAYAIYRKDPVFILGQGFGLLIYTRNLVLIEQKKKK